MLAKLAKDAQKRTADLYTRKAQIIEEVMRLRHEQAQVKNEIAKLAVASGELALIANQPRCW